MPTPTPTLWSFVGIYFNQDWHDDYGTERASVKAFIEEAPDDRDELSAEITWVLFQHPSEEAVAAYMDSLGSEYVPPAAEGGYRGWLERLVSLLGNSQP